MMDSSLEYYAIHELKHRLRKKVTDTIRDGSPDADPMAKEVTVMLGSILALAFFGALLSDRERGRLR